MLQAQKILRENNISPSHTRLMIYNHFKKSNHHPSVDEIYSKLKKELPTLSKTTVYNIIKLFLEKELLKPVNIKGIDQRYELTKDKHSHFKCSECGTIFDIPSIQTTYDIKSLEDFIIDDEEVTLTGICKACQHKKK